MSTKKLKGEVRKALEEIKYDDWHEGIHTEALYKAQKQAKPSNKEQEAAIMCGVCNEILKVRIPATARRITDV